MKEAFQVPEHAKSETDLINTQAVKDASETFLGHYADIAKNTGNNLDETIRKKAAEFASIGIQPAHIKVRRSLSSHLFSSMMRLHFQTYGENLVQNVMKDTDSKLSSGEEAGLRLFTDHVSNKLTAEMGGANNTSMD